MRAQYRRFYVRSNFRTFTCTGRPHVHSSASATDGHIRAAPRGRFGHVNLVRHLFLLQGSHLFLGRLFFLSTWFALRRAPRPPACTHARSRTHGRPTNERRDVRSAGVAGWITARGGGTERTLTAAAGPSPRDPYRHALAMRLPLKVRPLVSYLKLLRSPEGFCGVEVERANTTRYPQEPTRPGLQEPTPVITSEQRYVAALADGVQAT